MTPRTAHNAHLAHIVRLALVAAVVGAGSARASEGARNADEQALAALSVEWMQAVAAKDQARLEALTAAEFVLEIPGDTRAEVTARSEWIANAVKMDWSDFRYENLLVRVDGDHATVSARLHFKVAPSPFTFDAGVVDTWVRRDGAWQVTHRYLGQSHLQERMQFALGAFAALVLVAAALLGAMILRRVKAARGARGPA